MKLPPINPMLIHTIQDRLLLLKGNSILEIALYNAATNDPVSAVRLALSCHQDNPEMMTELLGETLMADIIQYQKNKIDEAEPHPGTYAD